MATWLGILWGNTHHHWGWFEEERLLTQQRFQPDEAPLLPGKTEIWLAAVGTGSPQRVGSLPPQVRYLQLSDCPLAQTYPTLGLDRALGLVAAGILYGWPVLVVDAGTALTVSGAVAGDPGQGSFAGGAIWPGLGLQATALARGTAALPQIHWRDPVQPHRWACETVEAIQSGILYTAVAGIRDFVSDWRRQYPQSQVVFTGGDGSLLYRFFEADPDCHEDPALVLKGIPYCRGVEKQLLRRMGVDWDPGEG